jgi:hypothetical protein
LRGAAGLRVSPPGGFFVYGETHMKSLTSALALVAALAFAGAAASQEMSVTIKSYDPAKRTIIVEDGTTYTIEEGVTVSQLKAGSKAKLMITEKGGKKVVTKVITD